MTIPNKSSASGSMTRRALLGVVPAIPAIPVLASAATEAVPTTDEKPDKNQPAYTTTPHIEAFYERSRF